MRTPQEILANCRRIVASVEFQENLAKILAASAEADEREGEREFREVTEQIGIREEHLDGLRAPRWTEAIWHVGQWLAAEGPKSKLLVLGGDSGAGKSFAGAMAAACHGRGALVVQAAALWEENFSAAAWDRMRSVQLLVIDDLGGERRDLSGIFEERFFALIDGRLARKTLITSNLRGSQFVERYCAGELARLKRRFEEYGRFVPLGTKAPSGAGGST